MKNIFILLLCFFSLTAFSQGTYIGDLPAASALGGTEVIPGEQGGGPTTVKITINQVKDYIAAIVGGGTVTTVGWTGGIVSIANATTTPAFTIAGTSGGIPYFSSSSTWATSGALAANALVIGGGTGVAPSTVTTGTGILTALGVNIGSAGAPVLFNGAGGTPSSLTGTNITGLPLSTGVTGVLPSANGGTNLASYTVGDLLYASGSTTISKLGIGSTNYFLHSTGSAPSWVSSATVSDINTGTDDALPVTALNLQGSKYETQYGLRTFATSTTAADTYTASLSPAITTYGSGGLLIKVKFTNANTGAATININSLGAKSMVHTDGSALIAGDIPAGGTAVLQYNGTDFNLINPINIVLSAVTASKVAWWDANKKLTFVDYASQSDAITGTDATKPLTSIGLESKRSIKSTSVSNSATGSTNIDCGSKQEVKVIYNTTVTGNITITKSNDSNLEILHLIIPITGSNITITFPSDIRMSRYNEVAAGDGWYQSTKILQVSSVGTADLHEFSIVRASGSVFKLNYDGPARP
jgi:hypothetical protein